MLPASAGMSQTSEKEERKENKEEQKENKGAGEAYLGPEDMFDLSNCGKPSKGTSILTNTLVLRFTSNLALRVSVNGAIIFAK